jgi:hypothetical protein
MSYKLLLFGVFTGVTLCAAPVQITINLAGGNFDRGVTTNSVDTGGSFTTSGTACSGLGCANLLSLSSLNTLIISFTVPSGSTNGSGSSVTGSLTQSQNINGFIFTGQSAFSQNSSFTENISATGVLGHAGAFTGTLTLNWSGNAAVQARSATGAITLNGDIAGVPEPASALLISFPLAALLALRKLRRS